MRHGLGLLLIFFVGTLPCAGAPPRSESNTHLLPNGIERPAQWPEMPADVVGDPQLPPYLQSPPAVIPIDVGRQLFVDDFLIEHTTLRRTYHQAEYYDQNPVVRPDQPWEQTEPNPTAMVFSDGVWYDPADRLFKMWYMAGYLKGTGYAVSRDGLHWEKPLLDVVPGTNLVQQGKRDSATVWLDGYTADPAQRWKLAYYYNGTLWLATAPDGIHWSKPVRSGPTGDRTTFFYNPLLKKWIFGIRDQTEIKHRYRRYWEADDFLADANWQSRQQAVMWAGADNADPPRDDLRVQPQLYNLDAVAYESLLLGLFDIWRGQPSDRIKPNDLCLGFSRDGFHWHRPDRRPFLGVSEQYGDWNWGNVQSAGGGCLIVGDRLYFYVSGRAGIPGKPDSGVCTTGLAFLRRDGFASLDADDTPGTITTRPVRFSGSHLFVNVAAAEGELRAEVLDEAGEPITPFTLENCQPQSVDSTLSELRWKGADDLAPLQQRPVRFRFQLRNGSLYAFWVSPSRTGASHGYVAAGGPGYDGPIDTLGQAALKDADAREREKKSE